MSQTEVHTAVETGSGSHISIPLRTHSQKSKTGIELVELGRQATRGSHSSVLATETDGRSPTLSNSDVAKGKQWKAHIQFVTLCWTYFLAGWNDGTLGPLLPRIQEAYNVSLQSTDITSATKSSRSDTLWFRLFSFSTAL